MSFWSFIRDMFVFDWLFGNHRKGGTPTNHTHHPTDNHAYDFENDFVPPHETRQSRYSYSSWNDGHYASEDYYHDSHDDYAQDFDDFDEDF